MKPSAHWHKKHPLRSGICANARGLSAALSGVINIKKQMDPILRVGSTILIVLASSSACVLDRSQIRAERADAYLEELTEDRKFSGSVIVSEGGTILISKGYGFANIERQVPNTPQTRFRIHWVTMQFTAMAILMLHGDGALDVRDPICNYIPDCPDHWRAITIHHLLTHTSGMSDWIQPWGKGSEKPTTSLQLITRLKNGKPYFKPGEQFRYSNNGYVVLGYIIEEVSSQSYEIFLRDHIFEPLGMKDTGFDDDSIAIGYKPIGIEAPVPDLTYRFSASGLCSSVEDLYRWDQALAREELISKEYLDLMFPGYAKTPSQDFPGSEYGYGWFIGRLLDRPMMAHGGSMAGYTSMILRFPSEQLTIIVLRNLEMDLYDRLEIEIAEMIF